MMDERHLSEPFQYLREVVGAGELRPLDPDIFSESCHRRFAYAYNGLLASGVESGPSDIVGLLRQVIVTEDELHQKKGSNFILVPKRAPWPTPEVWRNACFEVSERESQIMLKAVEWKPTWLPQADEFTPGSLVFSEAWRRNYGDIPGDPFLKHARRNSYKSVGQCEAVRAVLTAPVGSTLLVNLPTGAGKSLCAHLPPLIRTHKDGVTVVVVPTTALAIDQERSLEDLIDHPTAYVGGMSPENRKRNLDIRVRIRNGTQRIVFTSPESLLRSLSGPVSDAAKAGSLNMLVVDEAHIVDQWGDEFRSEFQEIAGFRRHLLRQCPAGKTFLTLLLSATITESCLELLKTLFGQPGPFKTVNAVQLRPEPEYWFAHCTDEDERGSRLVEAVRCLPKPLIVYATRPVHAEYWAAELRGAGFARLAVFSGATTNNERIELIQKWSQGRLDIMLATSAFGLGVDQQDVRTVIHVCIPETVDRYYQEVGRGGRDGRASISLVLHTNKDRGAAGRLNRKILIGVKKGRARWSSMFGARESRPDNAFRIPIDISPPYDRDMENEYNVAWNVRTLTVMSRAGMIDIDGEPPPRFINEEDTGAETPEASYEKAYANYLNHRLIKITDEGHLDPSVWETKVEPARESVSDQSKHSLQLMFDVLQGDKCISELLADAYSIPREHVMPSKACGGCPQCRRTRREPFAGAMPIPPPPWDPQTDVGDDLKAFLSSRNVLTIFYQQDGNKGKWKRRLEAVIRWLVTQGIRNIVASEGLEGELMDSVSVVPTGACIFFFKQYKPLRMPRVPTLIFCPPGSRASVGWLTPNSRDGKPPRILLLPNDIEDPRNTVRLLRDNVPSYLTMEELRSKVGL
jgi:ATP-dependent DNA helicase RecQ